MSLSLSRLQTRGSASNNSRPTTPPNAPMTWASVVSPRAGRPVNHSEKSFVSRVARQEEADIEAERAQRRKSHDSYYSAHCEDEPQYDHLNAADIRRQVRQAPSEHYSRGLCPHEYGNKPPLPLQAEPRWSEFPMKPSPSKGDRGNNYTGGNPGPVRAIYNDDNREVFDVAYHDKTRPGRKSKNGKS
ncbi:hypothetical protein K4K60_005181 [Colletotrichum sp. SAR11_57]|nr:hypothetical protein K4K60_005181 [Colletotrichum sp. SAR11_57]